MKIFKFKKIEIKKKDKNNEEKKEDVVMNIVGMGTELVCFIPTEDYIFGFFFLHIFFIYIFFFTFFFTFFFPKIGILMKLLNWDLSKEEYMKEILFPFESKSFFYFLQIFITDFYFKYIKSLDEERIEKIDEYYRNLKIKSGFFFFIF